MGLTKPAESVNSPLPTHLLKDGSKVATGIVVASSAMSAGRWILEKKRNYDLRHTYTASVNEDGYIWRPLMVWINSQVQSRKVVMQSKYDGIYRFYDGDTSVTVNVDGYPLKVRIEKPNMENLGAMMMDSDSSSIFSKNLIFSTMDKRGIDALEQFLIRLTDANKNENREALLHSTNQYGNWDGRKYTKRDLDSVILPQGEMELLTDDIETFLNNEQRYGAIGLPWHRGYLLHGEPGNGKSSLVKAVASNYNFSLYNLPLSGVKDDKALSVFINNVEAKSILLLEDIDIFSKTMKREQSETGPTLAGLLNCLDGVSTPHGLITFITTNQKETLDPALIRPGRVDYSLRLTAPDDYQIRTMFKRVYEEDLNVTPRGFASMAELSNVFKSYPTDSEAARLLIKNG